jgi:hypothetical protein
VKIKLFKITQIANLFKKKYVIPGVRLPPPKLNDELMSFKLILKQERRRL